MVVRGAHVTVVFLLLYTTHTTHTEIGAMITMTRPRSDPMMPPAMEPPAVENKCTCSVEKIIIVE